MSDTRVCGSPRAYFFWLMLGPRKRHNLIVDFAQLSLALPCKDSMNEFHLSVENLSKGILLGGFLGLQQS